MIGNNWSNKSQINGWLAGCIHVEEAVIWGKEMRACTHKRDNSGIGVIIHDIIIDEMWPWSTLWRSADATFLLSVLVASFWWKFDWIGSIIAEIWFLKMATLTYIFKVSWYIFYCWPKCDNFHEVWYKSYSIIVEIQRLTLRGF